MSPPLTGDPCAERSPPLFQRAPWACPAPNALLELAHMLPFFPVTIPGCHRLSSSALSAQLVRGNGMAWIGPYCTPKLLLSFAHKIAPTCAQFPVRISSQGISSAGVKLMNTVMLWASFWYRSQERGWLQGKGVVCSSHHPAPAGQLDT